jgi:hypothetical protein
MKTLTPLLACAAALWALGAGPPPAGEPAAPATGKVLVLDNERTLEGDVERVGEQYRVRRTVGETWVPGERVLRLCPDAVSAYAFLRGRANLRDPDERLRLAQWCRQHGLRDQALAEVEAAVKLRPDHPESRNLLAHLRQAAAPRPAEGPKAAARAPAPPVPTADLTAEALGVFATKVQPILMNACAGCHTTGRGGAFELTRAYEFDTSGRRTVQQNLAAVLGQVNLREPQVSPLLTKAVSVHGPMAQAPLKGRQATAYRTLEDWVKLTAANNPQPQDRPAGEPPAARAPAESKDGSAAPLPEPGTPGMKPADPDPAPKRPAQPADPFDPSVFNREMHPVKDKPADAPKP